MTFLTREEGKLSAIAGGARRRAAPRHADPEVYELVTEMLGLLGDAARPPRASALRAFELRILDAIGLGPVLDRCAACGDALEGASDRRRFDVGRGGAVCE